MPRYWQYVVTLTFVALTTWASACHEFWRDEALTWLLINHASSFSEFFASVQATGYPPTWYCYLYLLNCLVHDPIILQISNVGFASLAVLLFLRYSPFTWEQKLLFCFGFFPLYQYGVITRAYSLIMALLFAYASLRSQTRQRPFVVALILILLATIHAYSWFAAGVLLAWEVFLYWREKPGEHHRQQWWAAGLVLLVLILMLFYFLGIDQGVVKYFTANNSLMILRACANAFLPFFGHPESRVLILQFLLGFLLWSLSWFCFRDQVPGLLLYAVLSGGLALLLVLVYLGHRWHHGLFFIFFVLSYWVSHKPGSRQIGFQRACLTLIFTCHVLIGAYAFIADLRQDYSGGKAAAQYVRANHLDRFPIVGMKVLSNRAGTKLRYVWDIDDSQCVLVYLKDRPIYDPVEGSYVWFWKHYQNYDHFKLSTAREMTAKLEQLRTRLKQPVLVIVSRSPWAQKADVPFILKKLKHFPAHLDGFGPISYGEDVSLYLLE